MLKKVVSILAIALLAVTVSVAVCAEGKKEETKITKDKVPQPVLSAFEKVYPKVTVKEYEQKTKEGKVWYSIEFTDGAVTKEAKYMADGTLVGTEEDISAKDLPKAVSKAVAAKYAGAKIFKIEKETRNDAVQYEIKLKVDGKRQEVKFNDKGEVIPKAKH